LACADGGEPSEKPFCPNWQLHPIGNYIKRENGNYGDSFDRLPLKVAQPIPIFMEGYDITPDSQLGSLIMYCDQFCTCNSPHSEGQKKRGGESRPNFLGDISNRLLNGRDQPLCGHPLQCRALILNTIQSDGKGM